MTDSNIEDDDSRAAARAAWHSFFGDLRVLALGGGALGLVLAATASSLVVRDEVEDWVDRLRRVVTTQPSRPVWRLTRALAIAELPLADDLLVHLVGAVVDLHHFRIAEITTDLVLFGHGHDPVPA